MSKTKLKKKMLFIKIRLIYLFIKMMNGDDLHLINEMKHKLSALRIRLTSNYTELFNLLNTRRRVGETIDFQMDLKLRDGMLREELNAIDLLITTLNDEFDTLTQLINMRENQVVIVEDIIARIRNTMHNFINEIVN